MWPNHLAEIWPEPPNTWIPKNARAAVACIRVDGPVEIVPFADLAEAAEADRQLYREPCGPECQQRHVLVWTEPGCSSHVVAGSRLFRGERR